LSVTNDFLLKNYEINNLYEPKLVKIICQYFGAIVEMIPQMLQGEYNDY